MVRGFRVVAGIAALFLWADCSKEAPEAQQLTSKARSKTESKNAGPGKVKLPPPGSVKIEGAKSILKRPTAGRSRGGARALKAFLRKMPSMAQLVFAAKRADLISDSELRKLVGLVGQFARGFGSKENKLLKTILSLDLNKIELVGGFVVYGDYGRPKEFAFVVTGGVVDAATMEALKLPVVDPILGLRTWGEPITGVTLTKDGTMVAGTRYAVRNLLSAWSAKGARIENNPLLTRLLDRAKGSSAIVAGSRLPDPANNVAAGISSRNGLELDAYVEGTPELLSRLQEGLAEAKREAPRFVQDAERRNRRELPAGVQTVLAPSNWAPAFTQLIESARVDAEGTGAVFTARTSHKVSALTAAMMFFVPMTVKHEDSVKTAPSSAEQLHAPPPAPRVETKPVAPMKAERVAPARAIEDPESEKK